MTENTHQTRQEPPHDDANHPWIDVARRRGLTGALDLVFDVLEPVGPLGAQMLYVVQPMAGVFGWRQAVGEIAIALEEPGGVAALRRQLHAEDAGETPDNH